MAGKQKGSRFKPARSRRRKGERSARCHWGHGLWEGAEGDESEPEDLPARI